MRTREPILLIMVAVLLLALLALISLNLWGLTLKLGASVDYAKFGNWSDAIAGLGSLLAVVTAAAAILSQHWATKRSDLVERRRRETDIHHWLDYAELQDERGKHLGWAWTVEVQNSTQAPIYAWKIEIPDLETGLDSHRRSPLRPGATKFNLPCLDNHVPAKAPSPVLSFKGNSGQWWCRSAEGSVEEMLAGLPEIENSLA